MGHISKINISSSKHTDSRDSHRNTHVQNITYSNTVSHIWEFFKRFALFPPSGCRSIGNPTAVKMSLIFPLNYKGQLWMLKFPTTHENILHFLCLCYNRQITVILTENHYHWCHRFGVNINAVDYETASLAPVWLKCRKERKELTMFLLWFWQMHFKPGFYAPYDLRILIWNLRHQLTEHLDVQHVNKEQKWISAVCVCTTGTRRGQRKQNAHHTQLLMLTFNVIQRHTNISAARFLAGRFTTCHHRSCGYPPRKCVSFAGKIAFLFFYVLALMDHIQQYAARQLNSLICQI